MKDLRFAEEIYLAVKYLSIKKKSFFNIITVAIAVGSVALGVASLIITLAVMSGFQMEIRRKILGFNPHIIMFYPTKESETARLNSVRGVTDYRPFVWGQVMVQSKTGSSGAVIRGVDDNFTASLREGECAVGVDLAKSLGAVAGDEILVFYGSRYEFGYIPKVNRVKIAKLLETGIFEYDSSMLVTKINTAQSILQMGAAEFSGIGITVSEPDKTGLISRRILSEIPSAQIRTWQQMNKNLFEALKLEKIMMFIILTLIVLVAAFNIVSNLTLFVSQKSKDIGILKSLGIPRAGISRIFVYIGIIFGSLGIFLGSAAGISVCLVLKKYDLIRLPAEVYFISRLPVIIKVSDVLWVVSVSFLITLLATLWPSYKAGKMNPAEILRYG